MSRLTRRSFVLRGLSAAAAGSLGTRIARGADQPAADPPAEAVLDFGLPAVGKVKPVRSKDIAASPLGVGFEVLDRRCFDPQKAYPHLAELGVKWARCQTGWNRCERQRGRFDFAWLDDVVNSLLEIGVQPWFNLGYGNKLYTPEKPDDHSVGWAPIFQEEARGAWLRFVGKLAEHFGERVRHWEIWNEPNISGFWKPNKPSAADYVKLVRMTAPEIRRRVPKVVIVGGALAGMPMGYLEDCLEAGLADLVDRISYHPYRPVPEAGYEAALKKYREMVAARNKRVKLWQGENGCPSKGGRGSVGAMSKLDWSETRQAKWLLRRILTDLRLGLELTSYFHTVDLVGYRGATNYKGLLRGTEYTPKPAYFAYQCLCALFDAETKSTDLRAELVGRERVQLQDAVFVRGGRAMVTWWYPANLLKDWTPRKITVKISLPEQAKLDAPVLIDPMSGRVFRFDAVRREKGTATLVDLPLLDYPLIVTDAAVLAFEGPRTMSHPADKTPAANRQLLDEVNRARAWFHAKKTRPIWARRVEQERIVKTLEGEEKVSAGDFLCRGEAGEVWPQSAEGLEARYTATDEVDAEGWRRYQPRPDAKGVCAAQVSHPFSVQSGRGRLSGKAGDYVVKDFRDKDVDYPQDVWIVDQELFRATYQAVDG